EESVKTVPFLPWRRHRHSDHLHLPLFPPAHPPPAFPPPPAPLSLSLSLVGGGRDLYKYLQPATSPLVPPPLCHLHPAPRRPLRSHPPPELLTTAASSATTKGSSLSILLLPSWRRFGRDPEAIPLFVPPAPFMRSAGGLTVCVPFPSFHLLHCAVSGKIQREMASHVVGYPRMGPKRELKFALESFWDKKSTAEDLQKVAADLRASIWKQMSVAGIKYIPSNTFSYYDQVLDTTSMLGAVPDRYGYTGGEIGHDIYFSMARGNATLPAMEMTKWFDTNYHFIVPELGPNTKFSYGSHKAVSEYKEAKALGIDTVPVLVGPVTYLLLSKPAKGVEKTFSTLSLLQNVLPVYKFETCYQIALAIKKEVEDLEAAGIQVIQIDEAALREGLPLRKSEQDFYLDWAVHSFRITNCGVQDTTQIHTHMCYSNFNDIIKSIIDMDADVITIENSRSDEKLLSVFREGIKYGAGIGPGVYDIHSPRIPSTEEIADRVRKMLAVLESNILWVNPDCGLKTRKYTEVNPALKNMVAAAKLLRTELASAK
ncbi:hypothetical protein Taro_038037, partial [Colocasia esculenta]|nr:hypothetical protein [Colocasia esculenta]